MLGTISFAQRKPGEKKNKCRKSEIQIGLGKTGKA